MNKISDKNATLYERLQNIKQRTREMVMGTLTSAQVISLQKDIDDIMSKLSPDLRQEFIDALEQWHRICIMYRELTPYIP